MTVTLGYFIIKFQALIHGLDPIINKNDINDYYDADSEGVNLKANNLHFAISINEYFDGHSLLDPKYVRLVAQLVTKDEYGKETKVDQPLHDCT